jgi:hypothetical protein
MPRGGVIASLPTRYAACGPPRMPYTMSPGVAGRGCEAKDRRGTCFPTPLPQSTRSAWRLWPLAPVHHLPARVRRCERPLGQATAVMPWPRGKRWHLGDGDRIPRRRLLRAVACPATLAWPCRTHAVRLPPPFTLTRPPGWRRPPGGHPSCGRRRNRPRASTPRAARPPGARPVGPSPPGRATPRAWHRPASPPGAPRRSSGGPRSWPPGPGPRAGPPPGHRPRPTVAPSRALRPAHRRPSHVGPWPQSTSHATAGAAAVLGGPARAPGTP